MSRYTFRALAASLSLAVVFALAGTTRAASNGSLSYTGPGVVNSGNCANDEAYSLSFDSNTDDDGGGNDWIAITMVDGYGNALDTDYYGVVFGPFADNDFTNQGAPSTIQARPITVTLWDIPFPGLINPNTQAGHDFVFANGTVMGSFVWDPASVAGNVADCAGLPLVGGGGGACADGRINEDACAGPVALYCDGDTLEVWNIDADGVGSLAFSYNDWPADAPASNTKLAGVGSTQLWQLDTGEFQVNADAGEGKDYAFVFNGCPHNGGGYNANIDPNE